MGFAPAAVLLKSSGRTPAFPAITAYSVKSQTSGAWSERMTSGMKKFSTVSSGLYRMKSS